MKKERIICIAAALLLTVTVVGTYVGSIVHKNTDNNILDVSQESDGSSTIDDFEITSSDGSITGQTGNTSSSDNSEASDISNESKVKENSEKEKSDDESSVSKQNSENEKSENKTSENESSDKQSTETGSENTPQENTTNNPENHGDQTLETDTPDESPNGNTTPSENQNPTQPDNPAPPSYVEDREEAKEIHLRSHHVSLKTGQSYDLNATILPEDTINKSYSYYIDDASVIEYTNGIIKAKKPGTANISFKTENGISANCKVDVEGVPTSARLNETNITLHMGDTYTLSAQTDIGNSNIPLSWNSSNENIVSVENGEYSTAKITAKKAGTATITVKTENGVTAKCSITVKDTQNTNVNNYNQYCDKVIELVNKERTSRGLPAVKKRSDIIPLANTRAKEISKLFKHSRPDGRSCFSIYADNNISYTSVGENIAGGQRTPEEVMNSWMNSEGHRNNILSETFDGIAVGCYEKDGYLYWVQMFIHG